EAIETAGYEVGGDIALALDVASSELYREGGYTLEGEKKSSGDMVQYLAGLVEEIPLVSIEDGMAEDDWDGWVALTEQLGSKVQLMGDDLFDTNAEILSRGIERDAANAVLVK